MFIKACSVARKIERRQHANIYIYKEVYKELEIIRTIVILIEEK